MRLRTNFKLFLILLASMTPICAFAQTPTWQETQNIIEQLGWVQTNQGRCGGYYIEAPFYYPETIINSNQIQITSDQLLFAQHGTSVGQGRVTITRFGQEIVANQAYLYRDPTTGEIRAIELIKDIKLREPNSLVIASKGRFDLKTKSQYLQDILYRTAVYADSQVEHPLPKMAELQQERQVLQLSAWGQAQHFSQDQPKIYEFSQVSYSTCPPAAGVWQVQASHLTLNKDTGRGQATNARLLVKGVPVFYTPYMSFPIDKRRKTGFLWPSFRTTSPSGPTLVTPFYWDMAPNYDMTISPAYLSKRGIQIADLFRYLTPQTNGNLNFEILPYDRLFAAFQKSQKELFRFNTNPVTQSNLTRLENSSTTRGSIDWVNKTRFDEHWSDNIDFNWVSDDYYLRDFSNNLNQVTQNQLLQLGELTYKGQYWNFTGRLQAYQTLHRVDETVLFNNQYRRLPQLLFSGYYPDNPGGFDYFMDSDLSHFTILRNPGSTTQQPMGNRMHIQPGVSWPFVRPYFTFIPRLQMALTQYNLTDINNPNNNPANNNLINNNLTNYNSSNISRALPIFDVSSSLYFDRELTLFNRDLRQTLEPKLYYTYVPYRKQSNIPIFDTTLNTLTYDQLFVYNRFSGIDRIGDANQLSAGIATSFVDQNTGEEKIRAGVGQIFYFKKRSVTLCTSKSDPFCSQSDFNQADFPNTPPNTQNRSPISGVVDYHLNSDWSASANTIWDTLSNSLNNQTIGLHYQPLENLNKIVNLGYSFVRNGDQLPTDKPFSSGTNLSATDFSFNWPMTEKWSAMGRWTQNWNHHHFQNLLYGLEYNSCCWAVRIVAGRAFTGLSPNNTFQYNTQLYLQFALKGLGTIPVYGGDPAQMLSTNISGIQNTFGRDF